MENKARTRERWKKKSISIWSDVMSGFPQDEIYSPVGFCISEIPICLLLQESKEYRMKQPGKRDVKRTLILFMYDLNMYQESHKTLKDKNEMIVHASDDKGECYEKALNVRKSSLREGENMAKDEALQVLNEILKTMDPNKNEYYQFLGVKLADGIKMEELYNRVKKKKLI